MNISGVRGDAPPDNVFKFLNHQRLFLLHLEGSIFVFLITAKGATLSVFNCNVHFPSLDCPCMLSRERATLPCGVCRT